eukprot:TRINITY_DN4390_c0_g1_i2.p1 TRINITY_DN4390_c0_g1~~TRINITY_DN4390_c0_g1_i2.p1  ORF type:complete len:117 (-),score=8.49 TRINITY_DN4390_c0_g1_i2:227-577(-)
MCVVLVVVSQHQLCRFAALEGALNVILSCCVGCGAAVVMAVFKAQARMAAAVAALSITEVKRPRLGEKVRCPAGTVCLRIGSFISTNPAEWVFRRYHAAWSRWPAREICRLVKGQV